MSSLCRNSWLAIALIAALCACDREERQTRGKPLADTIPLSVSPDTIFPGSDGRLPPLDPRAAAYEGNAPAIAEGQRLYRTGSGERNAAADPENRAASHACPALSRLPV